MYFESTGDGPPVVLLHGLSGSHAYWDEQVPALASRYRVITLDIRGHGRSDKPPGPYTVPRFVADTLAMLDHLGIRRTAVVGLSMGGGIAQTLAIQHPGRVGALGLVSTSSTFPPTVRERFRTRASVTEREGMAPLVESMMAIWFTQPFLEKPSRKRAWIRRITLNNDPLAFAAASRANAVRDWTEKLSRITCPTLFVGECMIETAAARGSRLRCLRGFVHHAMDDFERTAVPAMTRRDP